MVRSINTETSFSLWFFPLIGKGVSSVFVVGLHLLLLLWPVHKFSLYYSNRSTLFWVGPLSEVIILRSCMSKTFYFLSVSPYLSEIELPIPTLSLLDNSVSALPSTLSPLVLPLSVVFFPNNRWFLSTEISLSLNEDSYLHPFVLMLVSPS